MKPTSEQPFATQHPPPTWRAHGLGVIVVDHQALVRELPDHDHKTDILSTRVQVGGPVPTALSLLKRFGVDARFLGAWGDDANGSLIEADLRAQGIEHEESYRRPGTPSGYAHVWVEDGSGKRSIAAYRGPENIDIPFEWKRGLRPQDALLLDGWPPPSAIKAAQAMREGGGKVFLDLGSPKDRLPELLNLVDHVNCPERLLTRLFGPIDIEAGAHRLLAMGPTSVTVTSGEKGAQWFQKGGRWTQPGFPVSAVDTTGAGDVFSGSIAYGTMEGWLPHHTLAFACAAAALKCGQWGNRDALPTLAQIRERVRAATKN